MKKIVVFGAGLVAAPLVEYLLEQPDFHVTVASRTVSKAEKMVADAPNGKALAFTMDQKDKLQELIAEHDLAVSLLPYTEHVAIAKVCIELKKHLVTTSYVSDAMAALDADSKAAGILLLNESGLDPGIDHMSAMRIIHDAQSKGGKVKSFTSFCGGLPAPDANTNPYGYKFSWSPKGVLLAGTNTAQFKEDGQEKTVSPQELFASYKIRSVPGLGDFEGYPNRNSVPYKDIYGIPETDTIIRGTFRYSGWCDTLKAIGDIGYLTQEPHPELSGKTYKDLLATLVGSSGADIRAETAAKLELPADAHQFDKFEWLGLFSNKALPEGPDNPMDMLCAIMEEKMQYAPGERDMVALQHNFLIEYPDHKEHVVSRLIEYGIPNGYSAMARTVGIPAAIAITMVLNGKINETGVHIPIKPSIYNPILNELEKIGIKFDESSEPA